MTWCEARRRAVKVSLHREACEHDADAYERQPLTEAELAVGDDPRDWEATPSW